MHGAAGDYDRNGVEEDEGGGSSDELDLDPLKEGLSKSTLSLTHENLNHSHLLCRFESVVVTMKWKITTIDSSGLGVA